MGNAKSQLALEAPKVPSSDYEARPVELDKVDDGRRDISHVPFLERFKVEMTDLDRLCYVTW